MAGNTNYLIEVGGSVIHSGPSRTSPRVLMLGQGLRVSDPILLQLFANRSAGLRLMVGFENIAEIHDLKRENVEPRKSNEILEPVSLSLSRHPSCTSSSSSFLPTARVDTASLAAHAASHFADTSRWDFAFATRALSSSAAHRTLGSSHCRFLRFG